MVSVLPALTVIIVLLLQLTSCDGSPSNVVANVVGPGSLNISWSYVAIEGEVTNFTVTVINQSNTRLMEVSGIQDQHYIFSIENNASCDVYSFQVTAMNGAGRSTPSQIIRRRVPSLPDISPVQDSLQHSLVRTASGVALSVTFNRATSCPDYPVTSHTFVLEGKDRETPALKETNRGMVLSLEWNLPMNFQYSFHVVVANEVGLTYTTPVKIFTTDVQRVLLTVVMSLSGKVNYLIHCRYLSGSNISGCSYILVSREEGVKNKTGFIKRNADVRGIFLKVSNIGCYSELLAYGNSADNLPVHTSITDLITDDECYFVSDSTKNIISVIIILPILTVFVLALMIPVLYIKLKRLRKKALSRKKLAEQRKKQIHGLMLYDAGPLDEGPSYDKKVRNAKIRRKILATWTDQFWYYR